jgi:ATP synthase protein I
MITMSELKGMYTRQQRYIIFLLAVYVLGWGFTDYQHIFLGLLLGTGLSLFNLWLLVKKTDQFGDSLLSGKKVRSLGMLSRMAAAVFAVIIAMEYPEQIHLVSVIIGLMTSYLVIMIDFFVQSFRSRN